ncbi:MAG: hypothetical protein M3552_20075 [Planctomycetota bacterium]|nr:hypothetical protein [Planctomycetaceae bacterium]MDQ3332915.1 hypothetical protein [Planctomycetota bacterium]
MILLGASNVTLGFGVLTRLIRHGFAGPLDVRAALGHGRSYGAWSTVVARSLPPIATCGLWESLQTPTPVRTYALLTDVGNDLMYGFSPEQIAGWVATCLDRLCELDAKIVVTRLPIARVEQLGSFRYHATRMSFFPRHQPISWSEMLRRARELDDRTHEAAVKCGASVLTPPIEWYGFDPIHIRWTRRASAWDEVLSKWSDYQRSSRGLPSQGLPLLGRFPERMRLFGRERETTQPVATRGDMTLSLY